MRAQLRALDWWLARSETVTQKRNRLADLVRGGVHGNE
jgi:hypothetical protein